MDRLIALGWGVGGATEYLKTHPNYLVGKALSATALVLKDLGPKAIARGLSYGAYAGRYDLAVRYLTVGRYAGYAAKALPVIGGVVAGVSEYYAYPEMTQAQRILKEPTGGRLCSGCAICWGELGGLTLDAAQAVGELGVAAYGEVTTGYSGRHMDYFWKNNRLEQKNVSVLTKVIRWGVNWAGG